MYFFVLASDYDGTIAHDGRIKGSTIDALKRLPASKRKIVLVTGRIVSDLLQVLPEISLFDCVVGENGGVLYWPETKELVRLATPVPPALTAELAARGVKPLSVGKVLVATWEPHENAVLGAIRDLGLELQVIFNKGAVMILPSGINKGSGLRAALARLRLSRHNTFGVGDAENDHAFLELCECSVAVGNALPAVKERADFTTKGTHGEGVVELIDGVLADERILDMGLWRHQIHLGDSRSRAPVNLAPRGLRILLCGESGSGKSTMAMAILEQLFDDDYQCVLFDPEGDFDGFEGAVTFGAANQEPDPNQAIGALRDPECNVILNLLAVPLVQRPAFLTRFYPMIEQMRADVGRPHWVFIDEVHHLMPSEHLPGSSQLPPADSLLVTVDPASVDSAVLASIDVLLATDRDAYRKFMEATGSALVEVAPQQGEIVVWRRTDPFNPMLMKPLKSAARRPRHHRKYAEGELPEDRSFYFRGPDRKLNLRAHNLQMFLQIAEGLDDDTWLHHLRQGDYSRWIRNALKDTELADKVREAEKADEADPVSSREHIKLAIEQRYTAAT